MKIKELKKTVNMCWSPKEHYPVMIAAGSAAQQIDASFSSNSCLELYSLNLEDPGYDLELKSNLTTQHKFQKIAWSGAGILAGGCDNGLLQFYSVDKLLNNAPDALVGSSNKHTGQVSALDVNPYQRNLVASGAAESEIFIWDLHNTSQPMAPGARALPHDPVQALAWNHQVQHILGSTFQTRCVVWDLRKNEPIMKLSDAQSRTRWHSLSWHPNVATQLAIASEDDSLPVIQLWDLRLAASPLATLEGHNKGVLSVSWSSADPDLLLSGGKDGRVLCWNPNNTVPGAWLLAELSNDSGWVYDVSWCSRNPDLFSTASFDAHLSLHSLLGGSKPDYSAVSTSTIMESFGGAASFGQLPAVSRTPAALAQHAPLLGAPPRWLKRPFSAKFAFGGKLVTFERCQPEANSQKIVKISQVVTDTEALERASELDDVLAATASTEPAANQHLADLCLQYGDACTDQTTRYMWFFLRANFMPDFRQEALNLLGFKQDEIPLKFKATNSAGDQLLDNNIDAITSGIAGLSRGESTETDAELSTDTSTDLSDANTLIERKLSNVDNIPVPTNVVIPNGEDSTSLICRALVSGQLEEAAELCLEAGKMADALVIASLGGGSLLQRVQQYYARSQGGSPVSLLAGALLGARWEALVDAAAPRSWRHSLAALLAHASPAELSAAAARLAERLLRAAEPEAALACFACAGRAPRLLRAAAAALPELRDRAALARLALVAARAAQLRGQSPEPEGGADGAVERALSACAAAVAAQGGLARALRLLHAAPLAPLASRLRRALARDQPAQNRQYGASTTSRPRTTSSHSHRPYNDVNNTYNTVGGYDNSWHSAAAPVPAPQPPRPPSTGLPSGGITSRSKYKVDPSVQSAPQYGQYSFNNPITTQPYATYNNEIYNASSVPHPHTNSQINPLTTNLTNQFNPVVPLNPTASFNPAPLLNPASQFNSSVPFNPVPLNPAEPLNPMTSFDQAAPLNSNGMNGAYYQSQIQEHVPAAVIKPTPPGWNDPPMMSSKPKHIGECDMSALHAGTRQWAAAIEHRRQVPQPKAEVAAQAPITHPLFGMEPQHIPLSPAYQQQQFAQQQYPQQPQQYQQQSQYQPQTQYQNQQYPQQVASPAPAPAAPAPPAPAPVQKAPLPAEFGPLQASFDQLRELCCQRAANPQMKRKLDDVQKKLECLYDLLRDYRLAESSIETLSACAQFISSHDYNAALATCTALATSPDFASVASFLPALKTLLQLAQHLL